MKKTILLISTLILTPLFGLAQGDRITDMRLQRPQVAQSHLTRKIDLLGRTVDLNSRHLTREQIRRLNELVDNALDIAQGRGDGGNNGQTMISEEMADELLRVLSASSFDDDKNKNISSYIKNLQRNQIYISMDLLVEMLRKYSFDSGKLEGLRLFRNVLVVDISRVTEIQNLFSFSDSKNEVRSILLN